MKKVTFLVVINRNIYTTHFLIMKLLMIKYFNRLQLKVPGKYYVYYFLLFWWLSIYQDFYDDTFFDCNDYLFDYSSVQRVVRAKKTSVPCLESYTVYHNDWKNNLNKLPSLRRKMSDPDIYHGSSGILAAMVSSGLENIHYFVLLHTH